MVAFDYSSDDDEDKCPLCIEDMDITDKNFKPCPCGFQICQFCYNNIRSGPDQYNRCPACRRPYDEASIEYRTLTPEEMKQEQERKQRKEQVRKQRERERNKESHHQHFDQRDKKHLANVRVIQKNLVYVIGLNPNVPSEDLQHMLRRDEFFGQYGKIQKIVVNKRVNGNGNLGVGVYVTFARKEDAARCIAAVDGSINDGKYLRAAYGTTKYCSSYLRGQNCPNQNCMFLHEPGEEADNFNRHPGSGNMPPPQGLSSISQGLSQGLSQQNYSQGSGSQPSSAGQMSGQASQTHTPVSAHAAISLQGMSPSTNNHHSSASASPVSIHSTLANASRDASLSHTASAGSASGSAAVSASTPTLQPASAPVSAGSAGSATSSSSALPAGATLTAANVPTQPAWGKVQPQIPPVQKLANHDLLDPAADSLRLLEKNRKSLTSSESWNFKFVSEILDTDSKFPAMFSLPLDDKDRLSAYNSAIGELDKLLQKSSPASSPKPASSRSTSAGTQDDTHISLDGSGTPKRDQKRNNNSQQLLAHLMRGVSPSPAEGQNEDDTLISSAGSQREASQKDAEEPSETKEKPKQVKTTQANQSVDSGKVESDSKPDAKPDAKPDGKPEQTPEEAQKAEKLRLRALLEQELIAASDKYVANRDPLKSSVAEVMRQVGGDLMQPPAPVETPDNLNPFNYSPVLVDNGPKFDLKNLPYVPLVGDVAPSLWSAMETHSNQRDQLARREKEFAAAKAQTKKRSKRIRV